MTRPARKFSLLDIMVFVAAIAAGLAATRSLGNFVTVYRGVEVLRAAPDGKGVSQHGVRSGAYMNRMTADLYSPWWKGRALYWASFLGIWPVPGLTAASLATFGLGLRQSRRQARRPGLAAGLAVLVAIAATAAHCPEILVSWPTSQSPPMLTWGDWWLDFWFALPGVAGLAVVVAWVTLAWSGRWAAERDWLDRLGRLLGACWIGIAAIGTVSRWWLAVPY